MIRGRLKLILATVNRVAAAALLTAGYTRPLRDWAPVPWEVALCFTINGQQTSRDILSRFWDRYIFANCSEAKARACWQIDHVAAIVFSLIVMFVTWYVVGLEIGSRGRGERAMVPSASAPRIVVDIAFLTARFLIFLLGMNWKSREGAFSPLARRLG